MKLNSLFISFTCLITITACKSIQSNKKSFTNEFFNNSTVLYHLRKGDLDNDINILDSEKLVTNNLTTFKKDSLNIKFTNHKNDFIDYDLRQYTVNRDLAFIVLWKYGKNEAIWFLFTKGKSTKKWYLVDTFKRTTR